MIRSGRRGDFHWLVASAPSSIVSAEPIVRFHPGLRLCITALDSGTVDPTPDVLAGGWESRGSTLVSPPLARQTDIPCGEYDEWYLLKDLPPHGWQPEVFVNYVGFTLEPIEELRESRNATWDPTCLDFLAAIQERFWSQLQRTNPESYVAIGDQDVVVSKRIDFVDHLRGKA